MVDYFKFWLAKELVPLAVLLAFVALFGGLFAMAWLAEAAQKLLHKMRRELPAPPVPKGESTK